MLSFDFRRTVPLALGLRRPSVVGLDKYSIEGGFLPLLIHST